MLLCLTATLLKSHQFKELLSDPESAYRDLTYDCEVSSVKHANLVLENERYKTIHGDEES